MTQSKQSPDAEDKLTQSSGPPKTIGVYDRPERKKPTSLIIIVFIVLLSLFVFWLGSTLF